MTTFQLESLCFSCLSDYWFKPKDPKDKRALVDPESSAKRLVERNVVLNLDHDEVLKIMKRLSSMTLDKAREQVNNLSYP